MNVNYSASVNQNGLSAAPSFEHFQHSTTATYGTGNWASSTINERFSLITSNRVMRVGVVVLLFLLLATALSLAGKSSKSNKPATKDDDGSQELPPLPEGADEDEEVDEEEEPKPVKSKAKTSSKKGSKSKPKADDENNDENGDDGEKGWTICTKNMCDCSGNDIDCSQVHVHGDEYHFETVDLDIEEGYNKPKTIKFSNNDVKQLKKGKIFAGHEDTIQLLDLADNKIAQIDDNAFLKFTNLSKLYLSGNRLTKFSPDWFGKNKKALHRLNLADNRITKLEDAAFKDFENLNWLQLDGNTIKLRKEIFEGMDSLKILSLDNMTLNDENFPVDLFENIPNLESLSIRLSEITTVPIAVKSLKKLKILDISKTHISELQEESFADDHDIEELLGNDMDYLYALRDCAFCGLEKLKSVTMDDNKALYEVHPNAFGHQHSSSKQAGAMQILSLKRANITSISEELLDWDNMDKVYLMGNPLVCDCQTAFLMGGTYSFEKGTNGVAACASPESVKGKAIKNVDAAQVCEGIAKSQRSGRFITSFSILFICVLISLGCYYGIVTGTFRRLVNRPEVRFSVLQERERDDMQNLQDDFVPRAEAV